MIFPGVSPLLRTVLLGTGLGLLSPARASDPAAVPLAYETSAYELAPWISRTDRPWTRAELAQALAGRAVVEKARHELEVYYYRIGHTLAFPLPVARRPEPAELPPGIATIKYPWLIWLTWAMEERWRVLHFAWRQQGDQEAGRLLQRELAALSGWQKFHEMNDQVGLGLAHVAGTLAVALADPSGWDEALLRQARTAATAIVERDAWPWYEKQWGGVETFTPVRLHNIPVITLARTAQLARVIGSPRTATLDRKAAAVLRAWCGFRTGPEHHTEGTSYDGFLLDSLTEWLGALPERGAAGEPGRAELLREAQAGFRSVADQWIHFTLPGRADLHVPLGDVEPEMPFWTNALLRMAHWYGWRDAAWLLTHVPAARLPAVAAAAAHADFALFAGAASAAPALAPRELPNAAILRTGWGPHDAIAAVSLPRNPMNHLHADAGQLILGWEQRFWITDPGYQQYRPGEERTYSIGPEAHNAPTIGGEAQSLRAARLLALATAGEVQRASVDLAGCYKQLPAGAVAIRDVWFSGGPVSAVVVRDTFRGLKAGTPIGTHWLGGHALAWAFVDGWGRLSDGRHALWIGTLPERVEARTLTRHPGSRGPLTLAHSAPLATGEGVRWWVFYRDAQGGWTPPTVTLADGRLQVKVSGPAAATLTVGD